MLRNYLTSALRNIKRNPLFSFLNILGFSVSVSAVLLIALFVIHEQSFDSFHKNADNIYRLSRTNQANDGQPVSIYSSMPPALGPALKAEYPGIKNYVRMDKRNRTSVQRVMDADSTSGFIEDNVYFTDPTIFDVFSFRLVSGNPDEALNDPLEMVITESLAKKYFGDEPALGQTLLINNEYDFTITGVVEDPPSNSSIDLGFLLSIQSYDTMLGRFSKLEGNWNSFAFYTFILTEDNFDINGLMNQLPAYVKSRSTLATSRNFDVNIAQPLLDTYLYSAGNQNHLGSMGNPRLLYIFSTVAILLLIIAAMNYMNLSTAKSALRATEVGVRKSVGALRNQIVSQYLIESVLISLICIPVIAGITYISLPYFNDILDYSMSFEAIPLLHISMGFLALSVILGLISGSYPALFLSKVNPAKVLKSGSLSSTPSQNSFFRNGLLTFQFVISIFLITGTLYIHKQLQFIQTATFEMDKERIINLDLFRFPGSEISALKQNLLNIAGIQHASVSFNVPFSSSSVIGSQSSEYSRYFVDEDYVETFGLSIIDGRDFGDEFSSADENKSVIINESAVDYFGLDQPVGSEISLGNSTYTIVGIVKDFHFDSIYEKIQPLVMVKRYVPAYLSVLINEGNAKNILSEIREVWATHTSRPMKYAFLDDEFDKLYKAEDRLSDIFSYFTYLTVFIACLGIFGLSGFMAEQRKKELGIRKVFGAEISQLMTVLTREFRYIMIAATVVAIPVSYIALNFWLQKFAYRIDMTWFLFLIPPVLLFFGGTAIIIVQSYKTATMNPSRVLRNE